MYACIYIAYLLYIIYYVLFGLYMSRILPLIGATNQLHYTNAPKSCEMPRRDKVHTVPVSLATNPAPKTTTYVGKMLSSFWNTLPYSCLYLGEY